ncbi:MAG: site-2 protease family protein [Candidatus Woesearchaeota archaeon]
MMDILSWLLNYKFIILFYLMIVAFVIVKWKKIDVQGKIIFLYRMKWGLKWMDKLSSRFRESIILAGYVGVGIGYAGLLVISYVLVKNLFDLVLKPAAVSGVSLVLPGVKVPGMGVLPFWYWLVAIFVIAIVHEFSHGIVARAHNITVKNTGIVFFGPIIGAFVEPDEKKLMKEKDINQYSVLAAGSFSNILLALVAILLLNVVFMPLQNSMTEPAGFTFDSYVEGEYPFEQAGIPTGTIITGINGKESTNFDGFNKEFSCLDPGSETTIMTGDKEFPLTLAISPDDPDRAFMGIKEIHNEVEVKEKFKTGFYGMIYVIVAWLSGFLRWLFLLSFGIGLFNLLPLPIVDGGRMLQVFLHKKKGVEQGEKRYRQISLFFLLVLLLNLFYPLIVKLFN